MPSTTPINAHSPEQTAEAQLEQTAEAGLDQFYALRIVCNLLPVMFLTAKTDPGDITKVPTKPFNRYEVVARTVSLGRTARRARARQARLRQLQLLCESVPYSNRDDVRLDGQEVGHSPEVTDLPMFVICFQSWAKAQDGPTFFYI
jgi:DNA-binding response OmpR family regulator